MAPNNQMIAIGGGDLATNSSWNGTDPWTQNIAVFDMNALNEKSIYEADAPAYSAAPMIQDWYTQK